MTQCICHPNIALLLYSPATWATLHMQSWLQLLAANQTSARLARYKAVFHSVFFLTLCAKWIHATGLKFPFIEDTIQEEARHLDQGQFITALESVLRGWIIGGSVFVAHVRVLGKCFMFHTRLKSSAGTGSETTCFPIQEERQHAYFWTCLIAR